VNRYFQDPVEDEYHCRFNPFLDALLREFPPEKTNSILAHPANDEIYVASSFTDRDGPVQLARNMCSNIELQSLLLSFSSAGSAGNEVWTIWIIVERKNPPEEQYPFYESSPTVNRGSTGKKGKSSQRKPFIKPDPDGSRGEAFIKPDPESITLSTRTKMNPPASQVIPPYRRNTEEIHS